MKILYLHAPNDGLPLMRLFAGAVYSTPDPVTEFHLKDAEWIVSYGYRHILSPEVCERFDGRAVNLHIGLLPWNRGAHPNVWSAVDGTPSGVTLHYIDAGIDTGDIIAQQEVRFGDAVTLKASYEALKRSAELLFIKTWPALVAGTAPRIKQPHAGTYHKSADLPENINFALPRGVLRDRVFA